MVPKALRTEEICRIAACSNQLKDAYPYLPKFYRKQKMLALAAVSERGENIAYVPGETLDEEICLTAIAKSALILPYIPTKFLNEEIFSFIYQNPEAHKDETIVGDLPRHIHIRWAEWQLQQQAR